MFTNPPTYLRHIGGLPTAPFRLSESVLVFIDAQREYYDGNLRLSGMDASLEAARKLLLKARVAETPVIHVVQHNSPGSRLFDPSGPYAEIVPQLAATDGETIIVKSLPSSFARTNLFEAIKATGKNKLIIAGYMTHMCVSTTVRAAIEYGFDSTVVASATATRDLPNPLGGILKAAQIQNSALTELADRFAIVVPDVEFIQE
jgi:nicotinamidase-related amidase